ncbi:MAG: YCF48-related protein, partial [Flavobacteriales bacterium]
MTLHSLSRAAALWLVTCTGLHAQWQSIASGTSDSLTAITWVDGHFMVAGGGLTFLKSTDNGESFAATAGYAPGFSGSPLDHLSFHDAMIGYGTTVWNCCSYQSTVDGGETWQTVWPNDDFVRMRIALNATDQVIFKSGAGVSFSTSGQLLFETGFEIYADLDSVCPVPDSGTCTQFITGNDTSYSTGSYGWTLTSNDRGATIQSGVFPYASYLYSTHAVRGDTIAYVDLNSILLISHDKGVTWHRRGTMPIAFSTVIPAFRMLSGAKGAMWGTNGTLNMTADSGATWHPIQTPTSLPMNDILFLDADHVLAVGDQGTILASADGGHTWVIEETGTTARLHALSMSEDAVIAIGNDGTILRRYPAISGFITGVQEHGTAGVVAYPNPAADVLTLRTRTSPIGAWKVIDMLGKRSEIRPVPL